MTTRRRFLATLGAMAAAPLLPPIPFELESAPAAREMGFSVGEWQYFKVGDEWCMCWEART